MAVYVIISLLLKILNKEGDNRDDPILRTDGLLAKGFHLPHLGPYVLTPNGQMIGVSCKVPGTILKAVGQ